MARIRILEDRLISKIAAGEVVERPASVVKELIENSLDAGASRVEIELAAGGSGRIRIRDDGSGMSEEDAIRAFERHATSKIGSFDDLERVATLGFRGEALAAIGAVARVELLTAEQPGAGRRVRVEGGVVTLDEPAAFPVGTQLDVRSLFWNVPARRKFLKRPQTELRRCLEVVQGYALARPDVSLRAVHEGRELINVFASGEGRQAHRQRIGQVFGAELSNRLVAIGREPVAGDAADGKAPKIAGFVGDRTTARGRRLFVFVNRRLIRDRAVMAIFYRAVRDQWQSEEFPSLFLFLEVPPEEVDVNVHPQKSEVRFRDPSLLGRVGNRLREALASARGEGEAPLSAALGAPPPLAWRGDGAGGGTVGGGRSLLGEPAWTAGGEVREGAAGGAGGGPRIAEVAYQTFRPREVPLSAGGTGSLRLLGQYKGSLILLEGPEALYLVDQHAAHERILYERFRRELLAERVVSQRLVQPMLLELAPSEADSLAALSEPLEDCGFELGSLSGSTVSVGAIPGALSMGEAEKVLHELAARDAGEEGSWSQSSLLRKALLEALAASQACRTAIKIHRPLAGAEMEALIAELFEAEEPYACPHGRPTVLKMEDHELERRFGRRG